jgi:hypothetical protein
MAAGKSPIRYVVLDFDGTCTRVEEIEAAFLAAYRAMFAEEVSAEAAEGWDDAVARVRAASPHAGWMLAGTPSAPAAADPYILAAEVVSLLVRERGIDKRVPADLYARAYERHPAPFRPEVAEVLRELLGRGLTVRFVSNSSTAKIEGRLRDLLRGDEATLERIAVLGNAGKFRIVEPSSADLAPRLRAAFESLPAGTRVDDLRRPVYLRRGAYFDALARIWRDDVEGPASTLICGDVWELDLAMPAELGATVHLVRRAAPYATYDYELRSVESLGARGGVSDDLASVLTRL